MITKEMEIDMPKGMTIDRTTDSDMDYIQSCIRRSVELSVSGIERDMSHLWIDMILATTLESIESCRMGDEIFILRDKEGTYVGSLWMGESVDQFTYDGTGYILGIFVEPEFRRYGIGSYLLSVAESWCRDKGFLNISLNVGWYNEGARLFYESHGYKVRSEVRRKDLYPTL